MSEILLVLSKNDANVQNLLSTNGDNCADYAEKKYTNLTVEDVLDATINDFAKQKRLFIMYYISCKTIGTIIKLSDYSFSNPSIVATAKTMFNIVTTITSCNTYFFIGGGYKNLINIE